MTGRFLKSSRLATSVVDGCWDGTGTVIYYDILLYFIILYCIALYYTICDRVRENQPYAIKLISRYGRRKVKRADYYEFRFSTEYGRMGINCRSSKRLFSLKTRTC